MAYIWTQKFKNFLRGSSGFTLMETVVALGILSMGVVLIGVSSFQVLSVQRYWQQERVATKDLRHVGSLLAGDALNAHTVTFGGTPANSSVVIGWTDATNTAHTVTYALSGTTLTRDLDGSVNKVSEDVASVVFSESDQLLTMSLTVNADRGTTENISLQTYLRVLQ